MGIGKGSLDSGTSHKSFARSKFLKAGSSHNRTPDSLFSVSEPSKVTVASGSRTSYTGSIKYNTFSIFSSEAAWTSCLSFTRIQSSQKRTSSTRAFKSLKQKVNLIMTLNLNLNLIPS